MNFLFQIALITSVLCNGKGHQIQEIAEVSCENDLNILQKNLQGLKGDWIQLKPEIHGECNVQIKQ